MPSKLSACVCTPIRPILRFLSLLKLARTQYIDNTLHTKQLLPILAATLNSHFPDVEKVQHEPHWPWSLTGLTPSYLRQSKSCGILPLTCSTNLGPSTFVAEQFWPVFMFVEICCKQFCLLLVFSTKPFILLHKTLDKVDYNLSLYALKWRASE